MLLMLLMLLAHTWTVYRPVYTYTQHTYVRWEHVVKCTELWAGGCFSGSPSSHTFFFASTSRYLPQLWAYIYIYMWRLHKAFSRQNMCMCVMCTAMSVGTLCLCYGYGGWKPCNSSAHAQTFRDKIKRPVTFYLTLCSSYVYVTAITALEHTKIPAIFICLWVSKP